ncbi:MAG: hypothetical protein QOG80_1722 [Pseudonocardiales bacterium]|nr:hypothetical protein [Pseudonocardiales bacterium]
MNNLYFWTDQVLWYGLLALRAWALVDCLTRKAKAFPAADKLTKPAWLGILVVSGVLGTIMPVQTWFIPLLSTVVAAVYLADVRPAVREISGNQRW